MNKTVSRRTFLQAALKAGSLAAISSTGLLSAMAEARDMPLSSDNTSPSAAGKGHAPGAEASPPPEALQSLSHLSFTDLSVPSEVRLMVFAPHPDDETLGAGGLIQRVLQLGGTVQVVFVTNGDGFADGVRLRTKKLYASSEDFIAYGQKRHGEAIEAIKQLGLEEEEGIFLGFPDGGIDDLWTSNWSQMAPYRSPYTLLDHPFYQGSRSRWVKYAGAELKQEIKKTLLNFSPDWVVLPDPRDIHPDHYTTGIFVLEALDELHEKDEFSTVEANILGYLVHYMDYPKANLWEKRINLSGVGGSSVSQAALSMGRWTTFQLELAEMETKQSALYSHKTQIEALGDLLNSFLLPRETFCKFESRQIESIPRELALRSGRQRNS